MLENLFIVIAEDDKDDTEIIRRSFEKHPAFSKVQVVKNGKELWDFLKSDHPSPHIILTDTSMPILNGLEVTKKIAADAALSSIPVFMYSSSNSSLLLEKSKELGVRDFFLKPFELSGFDDIPDQVLAGLKNGVSRC